MRFILYTIFLILVAFVLRTKRNAKKTDVDNSTVSHLDINKYMGTWYEIARYNHRFERNLVGVTATYELRPDGKITVINKGYKKTLDGKEKTAKGKAKIPNPEEPGKLKVAFFLCFYTPYFVMELDPDYQWALIGSSSDDYLWILSRTPQPKAEVLDNILQLAQKRGYNTGKLIMVKQKPE